MITEAEARKRILERVTELPPRKVPLEHALGCFVVQEITAPLPLPLFDNSAMDGYAVVAEDCRKGGRLRVVGEQPANIDRGLQIKSGEAVRIFTGAPIPRGADAIVMQEDVTRDGTEVVINTEVASGEFIRRRGCELSQGQKILATGERLNPTRIALLAAQGFCDVSVGGEARVAIVSTGDEVVQPGCELQPGQLYESNSILLRNLVKACGVTVVSTRHARDHIEDLTAKLAEGLKYDALIVTGGVSVGDRDLVKPVLRQLGVEINLWRVAIKPGKPFLFGHAAKCAVFGLPGNPVSTFVTFVLLVRPALLKMMGAQDEAARWPTILARLGCDMENPSDRPHYIRGEMRDGIFTPMGRQESHALFGLSRSNALLFIAPGEKFLAGTTVGLYSWA